MREPSGAVTFLFTDIEGSTVLWETHPSSMKATLAAHDALMWAAFENHEGYVFSTGGDGFCVAFSSPTAAVGAAVELQDSLASQPWPHGSDLKVRMAIDTGIADERDGDYFGPVVNRVARVMSKAAGGQILLTATTADLLRHDLPSGSSLRPVGAIRLPGMSGPTQLFELSTNPALPRHRRSLMLGAGLAGLLLTVIVLVNANPDDPGPVSTITATDSARVSIADPSPADPSLLWTNHLGIGPQHLTIAGGVAVIGSSTPDGTILTGLLLTTGETLWERELGQVHDLQSASRYAIVTHRLGLNDRADFIDPSTGGFLPGCGFLLPTGLTSPGEDGFTRFIVNTETEAGASINSDGDDLYVLLGVNRSGQVASTEANSGLLRVTFDAQGERCHTSPVLQENVTRWPPMLSGPVVAGGTVFVGDSGTLQAYDAETLTKRWDYFPASGEVAGYDGGVRQLAARSVSYQFPEGIRTETVVFAVDGEAMLHRVTNGSLLASVQTSGLPILVTDETIAFVDDAGFLRASTHDLARTVWDVEVGSVEIGPVGNTRQIVIATSKTILAFDHVTGQPVLSFSSPNPLVDLVASEGVVVSIDEDGTVQGLALPFGTIPSPTPAVETVPQRDPLEVVTSFFEAIEVADRVALSRLIGIDMQIPVQYTAGFVAPWGMQRWIEAETRDEFWSRVELFAALNAHISLSECTVAERRDGVGTEVACVVTHKDDFHDLFGVQFEGTTHVVVRDGLVRLLFSGEFDVREYTETRPDDLFVRMKVGEFRGMDLGPNTGQQFEQTWDWAKESQPQAFEASCGGLTPKTADAACGLFLLEAAREFTATVP